MKTKERENWQCDFCHEQKDTLYFCGKKQICEECRKELREKDGHTNKA